MNYATGCAFNLKDLFLNFKYNKLKMTCKLALNINGNAHRDLLVKKIFKECFKKVINDIIDNNVTFLLPTGAIESSLHMNRIEGKEFKKAYLNGKFNDIDVFSSNFSGYLIVLNMNKKDKIKRIKKVYVSSELKQKITDNTNANMNYC